MARFKTGWFKTWREAWEKDLSQNLYLWGIWNALLHMATWKETKILWNGEQRSLPPGSVVFGIRELATKWECSVGVVSKWLHYLNDTGRIVLESSTRGSLATICNWEQYQAHDDEVRTPREHGVNATETRREHGVNLIEEEKKEEGKKRVSRTGVRLAYSNEFESVWSQYGRKGDKAAAYQEYKALGLSPPEHDRLSLAITAYLGDCKRKDRFLKDFERFLKTDWREWVDTPGAQIHQLPF